MLRYLATLFACLCALHPVAAEEAAPSIPQTWDRVVLEAEGYALTESRGGFPLGVKRYAPGGIFEGSGARLDLYMLGQAEPFEKLTEISRAYLKAFEEPCGTLTVTPKEALPEPEVQRLTLAFTLECEKEDGPLYPSAEVGVIGTRSGLYALVAKRGESPSPLAPTGTLRLCDLGLEDGCGIVDDAFGAGDPPIRGRLDILNQDISERPRAYFALDLAEVDITDVALLRRVFDDVGAALELKSAGVRFELLGGESVTRLEQRAVYSFLTALENLVRHHGYSVKTRLKISKR